MADETPRRRVKATGAAAHHSGTLRAAVKPHKSAPKAGTKQLINDYMNGLTAGSTSHTIWGNSVAKHAATLCKNFGLAAADEPYLLLDAGDGTGRAGMLLSTSGVHFANGRGGSSAVTWRELAGCTVAYQRGMLMVGKSGITSSDGKALVTLLQQLQSKLAK